LKNLFKRKANYNIINNSNNKIQSNSLSLNNNKANSTFYSNNNLEKNNSMYGLNYVSKKALFSPQKNQTQTNFFKRSQSHLNINNLNIKTNPHSLNSLTTLHRNNSQNKITSILNNTTYKPNYKYFSPILKNNNNNKIIEKIKYNTLRLKLKRDKKDNKKNEQNNKTHFKGVESLTIKPKEIYDLFKFEEIMKIKKLNRKKDLFNRLKKDDERDEKNEYKLDIEELMAEEKEIKNIINTKEMTKLIGNKKIYKEVEYKNDKLNLLKNESDNINTEERNKKMNYLKKLAFEGNEGLIESSNEEKSERFKRNYNIKDPKTELKINGKVYQMRNQMDKICKELLIKYKVIESNKKNKK